jgi:hypothetical protein
MLPAIVRLSPDPSKDGLSAAIYVFLPNVSDSSSGRNSVTCVDRTRRRNYGRDWLALVADLAVRTQTEGSDTTSART